MKKLLMSAAAAMLATPVLAEADIIRKQSDADVDTTVSRLVEAVEGAGASVLARIDHGAGAQDAGMEIGESELVIFGNPKAGTPVMMENREAGLILPLHVLVYEDEEGEVWVAHEDIAARLEELEGLDDNGEVIAPLIGAMENMTNAAVSD